MKNEKRTGIVINACSFFGYYIYLSTIRLKYELLLGIGSK